jgi:hypothetical protein
MERKIIMSVFRVEKTKNYTVMSNYHLRDKRLSLKSRGLLSLMLSLPENWNYTSSGLSAICKDGKEAIRSAIRELEEAKYIIREQGRDEQGRLSGNVYTIYEQPYIGNPLPHMPLTENPPTVKPLTVFQPELNIYKQIPERQNTDFINQPINRATADTIDEIETYRQIIHNNIDYDIISQSGDTDRLDEIVEIILDCVCTSKDTVRIAKEDIPREVVKSRFLKINSEHINYVFYCLDRNTSKVYNIKEYLKTALYNSVATISNFYSAEVSHDLFGG